MGYRKSKFQVRIAAVMVYKPLCSTKVFFFYTLQSREHIKQGQQHGRWTVWLPVL
jgi:hypothetical protein